VRVHCHGADKLLSARGSALRVEFYHAGLHRRPSRPRARPAAIPAQGTPILEAQRHYGAPAPRVEPAASLPDAGVPIRVAAGVPAIGARSNRPSKHNSFPYDWQNSSLARCARASSGMLFAGY
jgi:hypothetical protein